jgi:predicted nucleic acid-binding protein
MSQIECTVAAIGDELALVVRPGRTFRYSDDGAPGLAKDRKAFLVLAPGGVVTVELATVARRKMQMSWADTHALLTMLRGLLTVHPLTIEIHENRHWIPDVDLSVQGLMTAGAARSKFRIGWR